MGNSIIWAKHIKIIYVTLYECVLYKQKDIPYLKSFKISFNYKKMFVYLCPCFLVI